MAVVADRAELDVSPTLDEVRVLAREHSLIPLRHVFIDDCETPVAGYLKLRGAGPSFLLESAEQGQRFGRWSFLGFRPRTVMRVEGGTLTVDGEPLAFDHFTHTVTVLAHVFADGPGDDLDTRYAEAVGAIAEVRERLAAPVPRV